MQALIKWLKLFDENREGKWKYFYYHRKWISYLFIFHMSACNTCLHTHMQKKCVYIHTFLCRIWKTTKRCLLVAYTHSTYNLRRPPHQLSHATRKQLITFSIYTNPQHHVYPTTTHTYIYTKTRETIEFTFSFYYYFCQFWCQQRTQSTNTSNGTTTQPSNLLDINYFETGILSVVTVLFFLRSTVICTA